MTLDTHANASVYKAGGFTDAQVEALVEGDRLVDAARKTSDPSRGSEPVTRAYLDLELAKQRVWLIGAMIIIHGSITGMAAIFYFALRS
jgi:hypothetical protein